VEVVHELGELLGIADRDEKVIVVGQENRRVNRKARPPRGAGQNTPDDVVHARRRAQEQAALDRSAGDLDEGSSGRYVA
jgi:hypothetical protein